MSTTYHMGIDVRGALTNWTKREFCHLRNSNGRAMTVREAKARLMDELAKGHEVIPFGKPCDAWDWEEGCKGHPTEERAR